ncbi:MAG: sulfurtransferase [Candidatus Obscuribacter sp.]|nr:sulfurtransferase [Candidatus Obscuribacter sp.]
MQIVNISAYKFQAVADPANWQPIFKAEADRLGLKGTILLSPEGINLFLAAPQDTLDQFMTFLRQDIYLGDDFGRQAVVGYSNHQPFGKMVVRLVKEIITMRHPTINPSGQRAPAVSPEKLKEWLDRGHDDEGRPVVMLDTRNAFEVAIGTFENAQHFNIERFSQFPDALKEDLAKESESARSLKEKTVVSFCTGGIRCEKAALFMQELQLPRVYQLDGGILRYFEKVGGAHYQGECFVFDERVALDPSLKETVKDYEGRTKKSTAQCQLPG